ncbi:MAG TPA: zinc ribbon domain-containing protein [Blastocatellia bacterium]|nr:zinc ribbon domain-containing protein [Blastocatellia bacterium]
MHCPNCGANAPGGQKFCRVCGLGLERFAQLLAELLPDGEDENVAQARRRLRLLERALKIAGWTTGSALGILFTVLGVLTMTLTHVGAGIILLLFGISFIATMLIVSYQSSLNKKVSGHPPAQPTLPLAESTNKLLTEHEAQIAMSVTEQTTARLGEKVGESR